MAVDLPPAVERAGSAEDDAPAVCHRRATPAGGVVCRRFAGLRRAGAPDGRARVWRLSAFRKGTCPGIIPLHEVRGTGVVIEGKAILTSAHLVLYA